MDLIGVMQPIYTVSHYFGLWPFVIIPSKENDRRVIIQSSRHKCWKVVSLISICVPIYITYDFTRGYFNRQMAWVKIIFELCDTSTLTWNHLMGHWICMQAMGPLVDTINQLQGLRVIRQQDWSDWCKRGFFITAFVLSYSAILCVATSIQPTMSDNSPGLLNIVIPALYIMTTSTITAQFLNYVNMIRGLFCKINAELGDQWNSGNLQRVAELGRAALLAGDLAHLVNSAYSITNFCNTFQSFIEIIAGVVFIVIGHPEEIDVEFFMWTGYHLIQICSLAAEQTASSLHDKAENDDSASTEHVEIFSLQLLHHRVDFNAGGFLKLDFSLLYSMVAAITAYVIIFMQFQGAQVAKNICSSFSGNCTCPAPP